MQTIFNIKQHREVQNNNLGYFPYYDLLNDIYRLLASILLYSRIYSMQD